MDNWIAPPERYRIDDLCASAVSSIGRCLASTPVPVRLYQFEPVVHAVKYRSHQYGSMGGNEHPRIMCIMRKDRFSKDIYATAACSSRNPRSQVQHGNTQVVFVLQGNIM